MKKYISPAVEIMAVAVVDVIATSGDPNRAPMELSQIQDRLDFGGITFN